MSVRVDITGVDVEAADVGRMTAAVVELAERWERQFSRFRPESELSRLNAARGRWMDVSDELFRLVDRAWRARRQTGGRFDPAVLDALERAGYDRSIEHVRRAPAAEAAGRPEPRAGIELDAVNRRIRVGRGSRLDLGGIAKGAFVDRVVELATHWPGGCIDAGGDLRCWGVPPSGDVWRIGIEHPARPADDLAVIALNGGGGAVATSATNRRRWAIGDGTAHHLIDPRTGRPANADRLCVTAVAEHTVNAEIETKNLLVAAARGEPATLAVAALGVLWLDGRLEIVEKEQSRGRFAAVHPRDRTRAA